MVLCGNWWFSSLEAPEKSSEGLSVPRKKAPCSPTGSTRHWQLVALGGMTPCTLQAYILLQTQQVPAGGRKPWGRHQRGKLGCGWVCRVLPNAAMAESREGSGGGGWTPGMALQTPGRVEPCSALLLFLASAEQRWNDHDIKDVETK